MNCNQWKSRCLVRLSLTFLGILAIFMVGNVVAAPVNRTETNHLRQSVRALNRICQQAGLELGEANASGKFSASELHDYQTFIAYLGGRIKKYCQTLYQTGGPEAVAGLNCPGSSTLLPVLSAPTPETADEQVKDLETSFINSLGDFDEILLEEQNRVAARQSRQKETAASGNREVSSSQENTDQGSMTQGRRDQVSTGENLPGKQDGENSGRDNLSVDDDIISRQLREAAEKETDPELKKKLWEEYRKYKAGK